MKAVYFEEGSALDYTAQEAVKSGAVVDLKTRIGIAGCDIEAGDVGSVHTVGVFRMDKKDGEEIEMGAAVYYDKAEDKITATAGSNLPAGYAAAKSETADKTVYVNIGCPPAPPAGE